MCLILSLILSPILSLILSKSNLSNLLNIVVALAFVVLALPVIVIAALFPAAAFKLKNECVVVVCIIEHPVIMSICCFPYHCIW